MLAFRQAVMVRNAEGMMRRALTIISITGLVASLGLWGVSYAGAGYADIRVGFGVLGGTFTYAEGVCGFNGGSLPGFGWSTGWYKSFRTSWLPHVSLAAPKLIILPLWIPALLFAILPARRMMSRLQPRHREPCCTKCGYDLTGSPAGCPECGHNQVARP